METKVRKPSRRNIRKLLARMNPKGMTFQPGSPGGIGGETALDIAAAIGMAGQAGDPQKLAVLMLCLRWWPGMFEGPMVVVGSKTIHHKRKTKKLDAAGKPIWKAYKEYIAVEAPGETPAFKRIADLLATLITRRIARDLTLFDLNLDDQLRAVCRGERQPELRRLFSTPMPDQLAERLQPGSVMADIWARVVIHEYRHPNHCQACQMWGRVGMVPKAEVDAGKVIGVKWEKCEPCMGQGVTNWSVHRRAEAMRIGNHTFRDHLAPHHNGALSFLRTMEDRGAGLILRCLGDNE